MINNKKFPLILPLVFALLIIAGIFIGININPGDAIPGFLRKKKSGNKLNEILSYIEEEYVDTISRSVLEEKTLRAMLANLDPHSTYISKDELRYVNESLQGNFEGIGVEFNIVRDTLRVISVIAGGPSETAGIRAGDKIVEVEGKSIAGVKISNEKVMKKLRGAGGTKVNVSVKRNGIKSLLKITITRGKIPVHSVDVSYMLDATTGYLRLNRFAENTSKEFNEHAEKLLSQGMKTMIFDLRGNPGGYLEAANEIADEFLEKGKKIVYTEGKAHPKKEYTATSKGKLGAIKLIVLIDEGSASASEIIAGSVQDNDKGTIVGRRSFGKGLVQNQFELPDSSAIRLTIARYYTPTGRCIQKPYGNGTEEYYREENNRYRNGEVYHRDSIHFPDSLKFRTPNGKIVYGGGGIMPDVYVPLDTSGQNIFLNKLLMEGIISQFAFDYADRERAALKKYTNAAVFQKGFILGDQAFSDFLNTVSASNINYTAGQLRQAEKIIQLQIKAIIARNSFGMEGYSRCISEADEVFIKALEIAEDNMTYQ